MFYFIFILPFIIAIIYYMINHKSIIHSKPNKNIMSLAILTAAGILGVSYMVLQKQYLTPFEKELLALRKLYKYLL